MKTRHVLFLVTLPALANCAYSEKVVKGQPGSLDIKVIKVEDKPFSCKVLGEIEGRSRSEDKDKARAGAEADLRNHALGFKGNYALIETERSNPSSTGSSQTETVLIGKALKCEDPGS
jgi:hypothetical protein